MKRHLQSDLMQWKNSKRRKPLILKGIRQVGKTWLLKEFGKTHYSSVSYFNFDDQPELKQLFQTTKEPKRILQNLSMVNGSPILPETSLLIFDEIQECNEALNTLKYFCEKAPEYHIACAGSLIGITLSKPASFPVGKVDFLTLHPMTFVEFLEAMKDDQLINYMNSIKSIEPIPDIFFNSLSEKLKMYFITGGMPEAVRIWSEDNDTAMVQLALKNMLESYERDFAKHIETKEITKLLQIWSSLPSQLSRENKKFRYQTIKEGARAREYENALTWLVNANLVYKIYRSTKPGLPLTAYDDTSNFKLYVADVGLLRRLSFLDPIAFTEGNRLFSEFKGALSENFILQSLVAKFEVLPRYWTSKAQAKVDFLIQRKNEIIPVEVKSGTSVSGKSLSLYNTQFKPSLRIRFSLKNLMMNENLINIPLFLADYTDQLISLATST